MERVERTHAPDLPSQVLEAAEAFELRLRAMTDDERVKLLNELLAWHQCQLLDLLPD